MPAYVPAMDALGMKSVNVFRQNLERGLPVIHAVVILIDTETGQPMAIMDGTYLTALRTGAVSGAAADLLARPDSEVLAVIGAGAQGVTQIAAICAVRNIERVIAVDVKPESLEAVARRTWNATGPSLVDRLETTSDAATAVRQCRHHLRGDDLDRARVFVMRTCGQERTSAALGRLHPGDAGDSGGNDVASDDRGRLGGGGPGGSRRPDHSAEGGADLAR